CAPGCPDIEERGRPDADEQTRHPARDGQHGPLDQQLADDAPPARAERRAHRDLRLARVGAGQEEIRDVRRSDEQDQADDQHEEPQRTPAIVHERRVTGGGRRHANGRVERLSLPFRRQGGRHLRLRPSDGDTGTRPPDERQPARVAGAEAIDRTVPQREELTDRDPHIRALSAREAGERRGRDTDDSGGYATDLECLSRPREKAAWRPPPPPRAAPAAQRRAPPPPPPPAAATAR